VRSSGAGRAGTTSTVDGRLAAMRTAFTAELDDLDTRLAA
jgi:hypothetical protein